jgi:UDP-glucose 4-epimerase
MMRVLVTGGAGFIGSCLVDELLRNGSDVLVFDNFATGRRDLLPTHHAQLTVVEGDIVSDGRLASTVQAFDPDAVVHLAGIHYIPYCNAHRAETLRVNVEGTQSVLEASQRAAVRRVVIASTAAVYGVSDKVNRESDPPAPVDIYGCSKWFDETLLRQFHQEFGVACVAARLFNVYGPNETNPHVIPHILEEVMKTDEIELGNLDVCRDFVYVKDVGRALIALVAAEGIDFGIFNVATGAEHSVRDIVHICEDIVGRELRIRSVATRQRHIDRQHLRADCSRIRQAIGWQAQYDLRAGLAETMAATAAVGSTESILVSSTSVTVRLSGEVR